MIQTQVTLFLATETMHTVHVWWIVKWPHWKVTGDVSTCSGGETRNTHTQKQNKAKSSKIITVSLPSWNHVTRCGLVWVMQYHAQVISTNDTHVQSEDLFLIWPWLLAIRPQIKINLFTSLFPQAKVCCFNHFHLTSGKLDAENENESQVSTANINRMLILFW